VRPAIKDRGGQVLGPNWRNAAAHMNANQFLKAVQQLQGWRECAFVLSLAERAFPNYALFADAMELKTGAKMRQILDAGWNLFKARRHRGCHSPVAAQARSAVAGR